MCRASPTVPCGGGEGARPPAGRDGVYMPPQEPQRRAASRVPLQAPASRGHRGSRGQSEPEPEPEPGRRKQVLAPHDLAHRERAGPRPRCRCRQRCCLWPGWPGWPGRSVSRKSCAARMARQSLTLQSPLEGQSSQALVHGSARSWDNVFVSLCLPLCFPHSFDFRTF